MPHTFDQPRAAFGIQGIAACLGETVVGLDDLLERGLCSREQLAAIYAGGSRQFYRSSRLSIEALAINAARQLLTESGIAPADISYLVFCNTVFENTALYPDVMVTRIADALGCRRAKSFALQHAYCVSPFVALQLLKNYFRDRLAPTYALVVCSDMIVPSAEYLRPIGDMGVHSDGAAAILLSNHQPTWALLDTELFIDPARFQGQNDDGSLQHDKRYFMLLAKVLKTLLKRCPIPSTDAIALYPNNLSAPSWQRIAQLLAIQPQNIHLPTLAQVAHVFGADPFLNLASRRASRDSRYALLAASGIAGAFGAALLQRQS